MAETDTDLLQIISLWDQLPNHLRNTITMLIDAFESTESAEKE